MSTPGVSPIRRHQYRFRPDAPVDRPATALAIIRRVLHCPRRNETVALLLDHDRRGVAIVLITGTNHPDDVVEIVELLANPPAHEGRADALVVASAWSTSPEEAERPSVDRWLELHEIAADRGVELLEWFEIAERVTCHRVDAGVPSRW